MLTGKVGRGGQAGEDWKCSNGNNWKLRKSLGFFDEMSGNWEFGVWRDALVGLSGKCGITRVFDGKGEGGTTEYAEYAESLDMVVEMGGIRYLRREMLTDGVGA
jgi:hypothetical protein